MPALTLLKIGGAELQPGGPIEELTAAVAPLARQTGLVIVHGGGSDIARLQQRLGIEPRFVEGLRVTDDESLGAAEMVLSGSVNKRLVAHLVQARVRALGLSGVDAGLLLAVKLEHSAGDLGHVGAIKYVNTECLLDLLRLGFTPVVSPISLGCDGHVYNVNADHAALAVASALGVDEMIMLTNVPGVLLDGAVAPELRRDEAEAQIATGAISGGMIPKVRSALEAVMAGVARVRITDLAGLAAGSGTAVIA
ncbi:MAG: acetylglutamate kinase [Anaerolineae bacterium]|jgi:acetylglutamate kinase